MGKHILVTSFEFSEHTEDESKLGLSLTFVVKSQITLRVLSELGNERFSILD